MTGYCNQKFWYLTIRLHDGMTQSCCWASPYILQPGEDMFNNKHIQRERSEMLQDKYIKSCEVCYKLERNKSPSRRTIYDGFSRTNTEVISKPTTLNIIMSDTCHQACSYCFKGYSTRWRSIIKDHDYSSFGERYTYTNEDHHLDKLSQKQLMGTERVQESLEQIKNSAPYNYVLITGGEPLLDNSLDQTLQAVYGSKNIILYSGLTVSESRINRFIDKHQDKPITIMISMENLNALHDFNRFGSSFEEMMKKIELLKQTFKIKFACTLSNLTVHGFLDFVHKFGEANIEINTVNTPAFLAPNVLDPISKDLIRDWDLVDPQHLMNRDTCLQNYDPDLRSQTAKYLKLYASSRNLDYSVFPTHFLDWLEDA